MDCWVMQGKVRLGQALRRTGEQSCVPMLSRLFNRMTQSAASYLLVRVLPPCLGPNLYAFKDHMFQPCRPLAACLAMHTIMSCFSWLLYVGRLLGVSIPSIRRFSGAAVQSSHGRLLS